MTITVVNVQHDGYDVYAGRTDMQQNLPERERGLPMSERPTQKTHPELFVKQGKTSRSEVGPFFKLLPWWAVFISTVVLLPMVLLAKGLVITARAVSRLPKFMIEVWREAQSLESVSEYRDRRQAVRERMANLTPDSPESEKAIYERFKDEIEAYKRKRDKGRT